MGRPVNRAKILSLLFSTALTSAGLALPMLTSPALAQGVVVQPTTPPPTPACATSPRAQVNVPNGVAISGSTDCPASPLPNAVVNDPSGIAISGGNPMRGPTTTNGTGDSIAIGTNATAGAAGVGSAVAVGNEAKAFSEAGVAIGSGALAGDATDPTRVNVVAIGRVAQATAQNATAIGDTSLANGPQATAIGSKASAGINSTATGASSVAGNSAVAYGVNANAGSRGTALGQGAVASAQDSTAVGSFASATVQNSVALGRRSSATRGAQTNYTAAVLTAPQSSVGEVAIGTDAGQRQITGVAAGSAAFDAVNVSQLQAVGVRADTIGAAVAQALGGGALYNSATGAFTQPSYTIQGTAQPNVGAAFAALDSTVTSNTSDIADSQSAIMTLQNQTADNGNNIATNAANITALQGQVGTNTSNITTLQGQVANAQSGINAINTNVSNLQAQQGTLGSNLTTLQNQFVTNTQNISTLQGQVTSNTQQIQANTTAIANIVGGVAQSSVGLVQQAGPGADLLVGGNTDGATVNFAGTAGARGLTGVAAGQVNAGSTDAVNGSQLAGTAQSVASALGGGATVNPDGTLTAPSYTIQGATQTSVGGALSALDTQTTANTNAIAGLQGQGTATAGAVTALQGQVATNGNNIATLQGQVGGNTAAITTLQGQTATNSQAITALDDRVDTNTTNITNVGNSLTNLSSQINAGTIGLVQQQASTANVTVAAATAGAAVDFTGTAGARTLTGLADGAINASSTDAVNGSQLAAANEAIQNVTDLLVNQALGGFGSDNTSSAAAPDPSGVDSSAGGAGAVASGDRSLAVGNSSTASAAGSTALGNGAQSTGANSVAVGAGSNDGGEANVVSVGTPTSLRRITNVGAGTSTTDAINLGQLNMSMNQTLAASQAYTDMQIAAVSADLRTFKRDGEGGTAAAMALAGIPQSYQPGMGMVGVGVGTWQGESAIAFGASKSTDNGKFVFKIGATYNTRSQGGANAGFGIAF